MSETKTVHLSMPVKRGETSIDKLDIRKPKGGELRGLSMSQIINADIDSHFTLLPRITSPLITDLDLAEMEPSDLVQVIDAVVGFFLTPLARAQLPNP